MTLEATAAVTVETTAVGKVDTTAVGTVETTAADTAETTTAGAAGAGTGSHRPSLSPSRAADFKTCPLLYRFRSIDRLPERPTPDQLRGTLVHSVLERLFDLPAEQRTPQRAAELVEPQWRRMVEEHAELLDVFADTPTGDAQTADAQTADTQAGDTPVADGPASDVTPTATQISAQTADTQTADTQTADTQTADTAPTGAPVGGPADPVQPADPVRPAGPRAVTMTTEELVASATDLLGGYFAVEDPRRLAPAERESLVSVEVDEGRLLLRGYIDRLDESPAGDLRVVDYKTGGAPREAFEARALFQLKFYALVLWRLRGVAPKVLRLLYLKDAEICDYSPDTDELDRFERTLIALWAAIDRATAERDFRPKPSRLCGWCAHQAVCPAFGGTPPPFPESVPPPQAEPAVLLEE